MKRKVIRQGHDTLTITLPKKWCGTFGIKGGDEIELDEKEDQLVISKKPSLISKEIDIDVSDFDRTLIIFYIRYLYRNGYGIGRIFYKNQKTVFYRYKKEVLVFSVISEEVARLMAVEILERKTNSCLIKCMVEENIEDFDNFLRRIFFSTSLMFEHLIKALEDEDSTGLTLIPEDHDNITKFLSYCFRVLAKKGYKTYKETKLYYSLLELLEFIVDIMEDISIEGLSYQGKIGKNTVQILKEIKNSFDDFNQFFYKFDLKSITKLGRARDIIIGEINKTKNKFNQQELSIISKMQLIPIITIRYLAGIRFSMEH